MESAEFNGISISIGGSTVATGSLSITENNFSVIVFLKEEDCKFKNPLENDTLLINPFSDPYIVKDQYHLIDTNFYSDFTVIESKQELNYQRLCFLGSSQKNGITVIFPSIEMLNAFYDKLCDHVTLFKRSIIKIVAQYPSYNRQHSNLMSQISSDLLFKSIKNSNDLNNVLPFDSIIKMKKYIRSHQINPDQKAKVWTFLLGIDINNIDERLKRHYQIIKSQWKTIHYSQYKRTSLFKEHITQLRDCIFKFKQKLLTVVYDFSILQITFNIIMSIAQVYFDFHSHYNELLYLLRVFYRIFVKDVVYDKENMENDEPYFIINDETTLDSESFETIVFWSMLVLIQKGRIKQVLSSVDTNDNESITIMISDFLFVADPILFYSFLSQNKNKIMEFIPEITMALSNTLSLCDCSDLWIAALASDNISQFINFYLVSVLLKAFSMDMASGSNKHVNIAQPIQKSLQMFDHFEIMMLAFKLQERYPELMKQKV